MNAPAVKQSPQIGTPGRVDPGPGLCEEASMSSGDTYKPCGNLAAYAVYNKRDDTTYRMCFGCADHNVRNRSGFEYVGKEGSAVPKNAVAIIDTDSFQLIDTRDPLSLFVERGLDPIIAAIEREVNALALDISTAKGRKEIASLARKIASSKVAVDEKGKELAAELKQKIAPIDAERKRWREQMDALRDRVRQPLTEWEEAEAARVKAHEDAIALLQACNQFDNPAPSSGDVQARLEMLSELSSRDWKEFAARAASVEQEIGRALNARLVHAIEAEKRHEELERLRKAEQERQQAERDEQLRREAAEQARLAAEAAAKAEADRIAAKVRADAEEAERQRKAAEQAAHESEERATRAEADRIAAEKKAAADAAEAECKRLADVAAAEAKAKKDAEAAVLRERERVAAEERRLADEAAKREANKKHRSKINGEALAVISALTGEDVDEKESSARKIVEAIARGDVPHVAITY